MMDMHFSHTDKLVTTNNTATVGTTVYKHEAREHEHGVINVAIYSRMMRLQINWIYEPHKESLTNIYSTYKVT